MLNRSSGRHTVYLCTFSCVRPCLFRVCRNFTDWQILFWQALRLKKVKHSLLFFLFFSDWRSHGSALSFRLDLNWGSSSCNEKGRRKERIERKSGDVLLLEHSIFFRFGFCLRGSIPHAQADYGEDRQMSRGTSNHYPLGSALSSEQL